MLTNSLFFTTRWVCGFTTSVKEALEVNSPPVYLFFSETFFDEDQIEDCNETALLIDIELIRQIDELVQKCKLAGVLHEVTKTTIRNFRLRYVVGLTA